MCGGAPADFEAIGQVISVRVGGAWVGVSVGEVGVDFPVGPLLGIGLGCRGLPVRALVGQKFGGVFVAVEEPVVVAVVVFLFNEFAEADADIADCRVNDSFPLDGGGEAVGAFSDA